MCVAGCVYVLLLRVRVAGCELYDVLLAVCDAMFNVMTGITSRYHICDRTSNIAYKRVNS